MISDKDALIDACDRFPDEETPLLALADQCDDTGSNEKAALIRLIVAVQVQMQDQAIKTGGAAFSFPNLHQFPPHAEAHYPALLDAFQALKTDPTAAHIAKTRSLFTNLLRNQPLGNLRTPEGQKQQYDAQVLLHQTLGHIVERHDVKGIDGIDGFYQLPTLAKVRAYLSTIGVESDDQLLLEPFAVPLHTQFQKAQAWMLANQDLFLSVGISPTQPISYMPEFIRDGKGRQIVYYSRRIDRSQHGCFSKNEILYWDKDGKCPAVGWRIRAIPESSCQIAPPHRGVSEEESLREHLPAFHHPHQRLTPETYLQLWLTRFLATGQMLDSNDKDPTGTLLPGASTPFSATYAQWYPHAHQLQFGYRAFDDSRRSGGIRRSR